MKSSTTTIEVTAAERYAYLDLTDDLQRAIKDAGVTDGAAIAFCAHTTCALLINEWEDGAMADFRRHMTELVPHEGVYYAHDDFEIRTQNMNEDEREERPRAREGDAAVGHVARDPGRGGGAGVRPVAAADLLRDGRAEGTRASCSTCSAPERLHDRWP